MKQDARGEETLGKDKGTASAEDREEIEGGGDAEADGGDAKAVGDGCEIEGPRRMRGHIVLNLWKGRAWGWGDRGGTNVWFEDGSPRLSRRGSGGGSAMTVSIWVFRSVADW